MIPGPDRQQRSFAALSLEPEHDVADQVHPALVLVAYLSSTPISGPKQVKLLNNVPLYLTTSHLYHLYRVSGFRTRMAWRGARVRCVAPVRIREFLKDIEWVFLERIVRSNPGMIRALG